MNNRKLKYVFAAFCVVLVIIGVVGIAFGNITMANGIETATANKEQIKKLQVEADALEAKKSSESEELASYSNSAAKDGNVIATMQTTMSGLTLPTQKDVLKSDMADIRDKFVNPSDAKPWYFGTKNNPGGVWTFKSAYSFKADKMNVIWICSNSTSGMVLAYATGVYDANKHVFSDINVVETNRGAEYHDAKADAEVKACIDEVLKELEVD